MVMSKYQVPRLPWWGLNIKFLSSSSAMVKSMSRVSCLPWWGICIDVLSKVRVSFSCEPWWWGLREPQWWPSAEFPVCPGLLYCRAHVGGLHNIVKINLGHRRLYPRGRHFRSIAGDQNKSCYVYSYDIQYGSSQINQRIASVSTPRHILQWHVPN